MACARRRYRYLGDNLAFARPWGACRQTPPKNDKECKDEGDGKDVRPGGKSPIEWKRGPYRAGHREAEQEAGSLTKISTGRFSGSALAVAENATYDKI